MWEIKPRLTRLPQGVLEPHLGCQGLSHSGPHRGKATADGHKTRYTRPSTDTSQDCSSRKGEGVGPRPTRGMSQIVEGFPWGWQGITDITHGEVSSSEPKSKLHQWTEISLEFRVHQSPGLRLTPVLVVFTSGTKVNPGGLKAVDKQHREPFGGLHPSSHSHTCVVIKALYHTGYLPSTPSRSRGTERKSPPAPFLRLGSSGPERFSVGAQGRG